MLKRATAATFSTILRAFNFARHLVFATYGNCASTFFVMVTWSRSIQNSTQYDVNTDYYTVKRNETISNQTGVIFVLNRVE
jgi:hypothetical protein